MDTNGDEVFPIDYYDILVDYLYKAIALREDVPHEQESNVDELMSVILKSMCRMSDWAFEEVGGVEDSGQQHRTERYRALSDSLRTISTIRCESQGWLRNEFDKLTDAIIQEMTKIAQEE